MLSHTGISISTYAAGEGVHHTCSSYCRRHCNFPEQWDSPSRWHKRRRFGSQRPPIPSKEVGINIFSDYHMNGATMEDRSQWWFQGSPNPKAGQSLCNFRGISRSTQPSVTWWTLKWSKRRGVSAPRVCVAFTDTLLMTVGATITEWTKQGWNALRLSTALKDISLSMEGAVSFKGSDKST